MNELINSPIIKEGTIKVEIEQKSVITLAVAVLLVAVIIMLFNLLLHRSKS
jgi:hypothetical protein